MRLEIIASPRLFPPCVSTCSARIIEGDARVHFEAGRWCAARAIEALGLTPPAAIPRGPAGEPMWPSGLTGSITHTGDYVSAAVARQEDLLSLGLDAERIIEPERAARVERAILLPEEATLGGENLAPNVRVTLIFSIKEATFKCIYPLVGTRFYYEAVCLTSVDLESGSFCARLVIGLSAAFPSGRSLEGRFVVDEGRLCSGLWLTLVGRSGDDDDGGPEPR